MLVPAVVVAIGLFEGGAWGGLLGLAAGSFCDMGSSEQLILFTVLFPAVGFFSGVLGKYLFNRSLVSYMALFLLMMTVITACQMFPFLFFADTEAWAVWRTGLIQIFWSLPWAVPIYFPIKSIASRPL
jgi:LytS/YehU family sensor histidine kinase